MIRAVPLGVYVPGTSWIHRIPASAKFIAVLLLIPAVTFLPTQPWHVGIVTAAIAVLYVVARIPVRTAWTQFTPVIPILVGLGLYLWWQNGPVPAATAMLSIFTTLAAANLLTLTTTMEELLHTLERGLAPFGRFGLPVESISLAIALTIRLIPLMFITVNEVFEARKARGADFSFAAFGTPVLVRSIRRAESISEALLARGAAD
ncbi:energy-coupling factor transporter transmembrane protein EcfT [Corynebacterium sp. LK2510]